jgi:hypothetical protein
LFELETAQSKQENLRSIWANASATLGESLLPIASTFYDVLGKLIPRLVEVLLPAIGYLSERMQGWAAWVIERMPLVEEVVGRFAQRVIDMWPAVVGWIGETADTVRAKWPDIVQAFLDVRELAGQVAVKIGELWAKFRELPPEVQAFVGAAIALKALGLDGVFHGIIGGVAGLIGPMLGLNAAMLSNPVGWFMAALVATAAVMAGLAIALVDFYKKNDEFRRQWDAAWEDMKEAVAEFMVVWKRDLEPALRAFLPWLAEQVVRFFIGMGQAVRFAAWWTERLVGAMRNLKDIMDTIDWGKIESRSGPAVSPVVQGLGGTFGGIFRATGGPVPGAGNGDTVPAMLTPGEYVLNRRMVSQAGGVRQLEGWRAGLSSPSGIEIGTIIINNPIAEESSQSLPRAVRKAAYAGVGA